MSHIKLKCTYKTKSGLLVESHILPKRDVKQPELQFAESLGFVRFSGFVDQTGNELYELDKVLYLDGSDHGVVTTVMRGDDYNSDDYSLVIDNGCDGAICMSFDEENIYKLL